MSDTVLFYNNDSRPNVLRKHITPLMRSGSPITASVDFLDPYDLEAPRFLLDYDSDICGQCNYIEISGSGMYYFVGDPILLPGGRMLMEGEIDWLMSYQSDILSSEIWVERNEDYFSRYYADSDLPQDVRDNRAIYMFPNNPFNNPNFILITSGGEGL